MAFDFAILLWILYFAALAFGRRRFVRRKRIVIGTLIATLLLLGLQVGLSLGTRSGFSFFQIRDGRAVEFTPWLDALVPERTLVALGAFAFDELMESEGRSGNRHELLSAEYPRMEQVTGSYFPSPILTGLLIPQTNHAFRVIKFDAVTPGPAKPAIFLHGGAGSFVMECWLVASILRENGYTTYCPTYDFVGWWPKPAGEAIFAGMLAYVQAAYPEKKVLLAGLSNGGHGALAFSARFEKDLSGMILLSGGVPKYPQGRVPGLILWGKQDERIPIDLGRQIYARARNRDRMVELEGDHFVLLRRHEEVAAVIREWLGALR